MAKNAAEIKEAPLEQYEAITKHTNHFYGTIKTLLRDTIEWKDIAEVANYQVSNCLDAKHHTRENALSLWTLQTFTAKDNNVAEQVKAFDYARTLILESLEDEPQLLNLLEKFDERFLTLLDVAISPKKLDEYLTEVKHYLTTTKDGRKRDRAVGFILGDTLAGKGTAMKGLGIRSLETGTEGIVGHTDEYEHWREVMAAYDLPYTKGFYYPSRLMMLAVAMEMQQERERLDAAGSFDEPINISGFPRTAEQAEFFKGIPVDQMVAPVFLTLDEDTALQRTIYRMYQDYSNPKKDHTWRIDDFNSLEFGDGSEKLFEIIQSEFDAIAKKFSGKGFFEGNDIRNELDDYIVKNGIKLGKEARWHQDKKRREEVIYELVKLFPGWEPDNHENNKIDGQIQIISVGHLSLKEEQLALANAISRAGQQILFPTA